MADRKKLLSRVTTGSMVLSQLFGRCVRFSGLFMIRWKLLMWRLCKYLCKTELHDA